MITCPRGFAGNLVFFSNKKANKKEKDSRRTRFSRLNLVRRGGGRRR
jgi:hypothetical protein